MKKKELKDKLYLAIVELIELKEKLYLAVERNVRYGNEIAELKVLNKRLRAQLDAYQEEARGGREG
jgi:hypothetical protein